MLRCDGSNRHGRYSTTTTRGSSVSVGAVSKSVSQLSYVRETTMFFFLKLMSSSI